MRIDIALLLAQKTKNPARIAEIKEQVQRLDQQLAADAQQQKRNELAARLKVRQYLYFHTSIPILAYVNTHTRRHCLLKELVYYDRLTRR